MKTLYRKEIFKKAIEENKIIRWHGIFEDVVKSYLKFYESDTQQQIPNLESDKSELLEALETAKIALNKWDDELYYDIYDLIQKHKQ